jgi:DNA N-6-adenine-methyltransferase (Dam)
MSLSPAVFMSESVHWATPKSLYDKLDAEFHFDFDPCPLGESEKDGAAPLFTKWEGRRVFCNPPYGPAIRAFLERATEAAIAVFLLPARTDTRWFHDLCLPIASEIRFIRGRVKFGDAKCGAPFPSMLVIFRKPMQSES